MRTDIYQLTTYLKEIDSSFDPITLMEIGSRDGHDTNYIQKYWKLNPKNFSLINNIPTDKFNLQSDLLFKNTAL